MYTILGKERISVIQDIPSPNAGAPQPIIIASEQLVRVSYICQTHNPTWDGSSVRMVDLDSDGESIAIVTFTGVAAHYFGIPNDEAFHGHPLSKLGLKPYDVSLVRPSGWISDLERMNAVHPYHKPEIFHRLKHIIIAFHDRTFEIACGKYDTEMFNGTMRESVSLACKNLI